MDCKHERLRTVGNRVFCCECQEELTLDFLMNNNGENQSNNTAPEEEKKKPTSRKRTAKKTV